MVRDFNSVIGREIKEQSIEHTGRLPDAVIACVGGGSNAIGAFHPFLEDKEVALYGIEAGGDGVETGRHAAPLTAGRPGVLHGNRTYLMEDDAGQIIETHSVSAGLDYPGVGPEHAWLKDIGRVIYDAATDSRRRIADRFNADPARKLLVPYITAGDPDLDTTLALMHTLVESGADIIELGIPFSDPMADGPVIQAACERALAVGTRLVDVLDVVARFRQTNDDTAVVLMGYMNPLERLGYAEFAGRASAAGVDGVLTVDLPPEESAELGGGDRCGQTQY